MLQTVERCGVSGDLRSLYKYIYYLSMQWKKSYRSKGLKKRARGKFSRKGPRTFKQRVTQVLNRKTETKYFDIGVQNVELYHNCGEFITLFPGYETSIVSWFNPWSKIAKGTERLQRIGDRITPRGMSLKILLSNKGDRPNTQYRIIVATLPKVIAGVITTARFDPFQKANSGTCDNVMLLPADKDKGVKFLYDKIHRIPGANIAFGAGYNAGKEFTKNIKLWIKRKRSNDIVFDTTSVDIVNKPLAIYVIPYEQYSTLETDNIASMTGFMRMFYKDF